MSTIFDNLSDALDNAYIRSRFGICCPDCQFEDNKSIHFLGNSLRALQMYETLPCALSGCCYNIFATIDTASVFIESMTVYNSQFLSSLDIEIIGDNILAITSGETACNNNDFYECITSISGLCDDFSVFLESGIIEIGSLNGQSAICILRDYIVSQSLSTLDAQNLLSLFFNTDSLSLGMVTFCVDNNIFIGGVEPFLSYLESTGDIGCGAPPPPPA